MANRFYRLIGKRLLDVVASGAGIILLLPVLATTAALVSLKLGRPVFFRQTRTGQFGRAFSILKFRSMTDARDNTGELLSDEHRLTPLGTFLRETSLDELPALWNVLLGHVSLVGPRPLLPQYLDRYTTRQAKRHEVRPGITGLAQIGGRNQLSWEERFELDAQYVESLSLWTDMKILFATIGKVINRDGISHEGHVTMPEFHGTKSVYVIGAGGHAKVVISTLRELGYFVEGIFDDDPRLGGEQFCGASVLGSIDSIDNYRHHHAIVAIGDNHVRREIAQKVDLEWLTVIHPNAYVDPTASVGPGSIIMNGAIVQAGAKVAEHVIVNTAASVDHDCNIEEYVHIGPGCRLAGGVTVGREAILGVGSAAIPLITIGDDSVVGAGAVVVNDIPRRVVAKGVPARIDNPIHKRKAA